MNNLYKAAECALATLENPWEAGAEGVANAIFALRAALQEPVEEHERWCASVTQLLLCDPPRKAPCNCKKKQVEPVQEPVAWDAEKKKYTHPPQRKPLTDEQCVRIFREAFLASSDPLVKDNMTVAFARAIEAAHGIGGEG